MNHTETELKLYKKFICKVRQAVDEINEYGDYPGGTDQLEQMHVYLQDEIDAFDEELKSFNDNPRIFAFNESQKEFKERQDRIEKAKSLWRNNIDSILSHMLSSDDGVVDEESIRYFPNRYPFSSEQFMGLYEYLSESGEAEYRISPFHESRRYFNYNGTRFIWRMMSGQGTSCQLLLPKENEDWPKDWPMNFDESKSHELS